MGQSRGKRVGKAILTGGASEIVNGARAAGRKKGLIGRIGKGILSGGMSEVVGAVRHKHFDELTAHENFENETYDPSTPPATYDPLNNIHDRGMESFLGQAPVKEKMTQYVRLHALEPSTDPKTLAGQCAYIHSKLREKYALDRMKHFVDKASWDRYVQSGEFDRDAEQGIQEIEKKNGFVGFDDTTTQGFIPLVMGAVVGLAKNKAVRGAVMKAGGAVKKLVQSKAKKKAAIAEQKAKAEGATLTANALSAGVPAATIAQISDPNVLKAVTDIHKDDPKTSSVVAEASDLKPKKDNTKMFLMIGGALAFVVVLMLVMKK